MVTPKNEPDAPHAGGKASHTRTTWLLLIIVAIAIIAGIAMVSGKPGADMGGSLSAEGGSTRSDADRTP